MWDPLIQQAYESEVYKHNQSRDWICMADINRDSKCVKIPCDRINDYCREKGFRIKLFVKV